MTGDRAPQQKDTVQRLDARGRPCPHPVIEAARAAADAADGSILEVLASDPAAEHDLPAWARMRGHELLGCSSTAAGEVVVRVRVRRTPPAADG